MAKEMLYTAANIKADEALRIGLVNHVYPREELMDQAKKMARKIAANAPIAVAHAKKAIDEGLESPIDYAILIESNLFAECFRTEDKNEGMGAFLEKRKEKHFRNK